MTRSIPFHKQTHWLKQPGQVSFDRMPFLKHSTAEPQQETTLAQYSERKTDAPKRMTFHEWARQHNVNGLPLSLHGLSEDEWELMETIWNTALKQGKL